jgi:SAM-dependent methyltransferase
LPDAPSITGVDRLLGTRGNFAVKVCPDCGSGTTIPVVAEDELGNFYPDEYSPHVDPPPPSGVLAPLKLRVRDWFERRSMRRMPFVAVQDRTGGLLDIGCGRGDLAALFIKRGWEASGIEPSPLASEAARAKGVDVLTGTLGSVDLAGRRFDAVTFQHSLEHVHDPRVDLAIVRDLLEPGGTVMVSVPNFASLQRRIFSGRWFHLDLPRHRFHYTPDGLTRLFTLAGFDVKRVGTATSVLGFPGSLSYLLIGRWAFGGGPWATRLITLVAFALLPIALVMSRIGGGDFLHLVATKQADDVG